MLNLSVKEKTSVIYHNIFDYPLSFSDLIRWTSGKTIGDGLIEKVRITHKDGFYFLEGRGGLIYKRVLRKRISAKKNKIAKKTAKILSFVPGIRMVGLTGSLAMENSSEESDIDLMIITKKGLLWTTRLCCYMAIWLCGHKIRKPGNKYQADKLCLNIWLDESDLIWPKEDRNLYTAHEIGQIIPLVNKNNTYEKFIFQNRWILDYWPNSIKIRNLRLKINNSRVRMGLLEQLAFRIQLKYMKSKITRELITPTRALFHPQDWGKVVMSRLSS